MGAGDHPRGSAARPRGQFETRSKLTPYDAGLHAGHAARWPGRVKPGKYDDLVSTIDLAPTILDACGATPAARADLPGLSLLAPRPARGRSGDAVFGEIFQHTAAAVDRPSLSLTHRWVRAGEWKLITFDRTARAPELYRVTQDPREETDLAARHPRVRDCATASTLGGTAARTERKREPVQEPTWYVLLTCEAAASRRRGFSGRTPSAERQQV